MVLKGISANQFPTLSELQHAFRDAWLDGGPRAKFAKTWPCRQRRTYPIATRADGGRAQRRARESPCSAL
jgi:hypothetical protein